MPVHRVFLVSVLMTAVTTVVLGLVYPLAITAMAQVFFAAPANGLDTTGRYVGGDLIGQPFTSTGYFRARPSAAGHGYDAQASGGSNLGPTHHALVDRVRDDVASLAATNPGVPVPVDLVTTSASGLDPHISPAAAAFQVPRVALERGVVPAVIADLVARHTEGRQLGVLGEPRVNVVKLNRALDRMTARP
jgi:K+-transporting ATPase ATPase C chain